MAGISLLIFHRFHVFIPHPPRLTRYVRSRRLRHSHAASENSSEKTQIMKGIMGMYVFVPFVLFAGNFFGGQGALHTER